MRRDPLGWREGVGYAYPRKEDYKLVDGAVCSSLMKVVTGSESALLSGLLTKQFKLEACRAYLFREAP